MLNFLFDILPAVREMFSRETSIMEDSSSIEIGIQIRTGDETSNHQQLSIKDPSEAEAAVAPEDQAEIFGCAEAIKGRVDKGSNRRIVWFLLSNSVLLRKSVNVMYGSKLLTNLHRRHPKPQTAHNLWRRRGCSCNDVCSGSILAVLPHRLPCIGDW